MIIVSRIIHVKVDRRLNVTNKFKYQRRLSSRLAIVMFRGTPCILTIFKVTDLFVKYFLFKTYMPEKKYLRKKAEKLCLIGVIVIESHSFLEY